MLITAYDNKLSDEITVDVRIKPVQKKKWLNALRSGKYKQGKGYLRIPAGEAYDGDDRVASYDRFCCLGVYATVCNKRIKPMVGTLPHPQKNNLLGTASCEIQDLLADLNDNQRWSFKKIAKWIEKNL